MTPSLDPEINWKAGWAHGVMAGCGPLVVRKAARASPGATRRQAVRRPFGDYVGKLGVGGLRQ